MTTKRTKPEATELNVTQDELIRAAVNEPEDNVIVIRDKKFELKDFKYKEYMTFIRYMTPLMDAFASKLSAGRSFSLTPGESVFNATSILTFCEDTLPKMALMVAHHSYPEMTEDELLELVPSPFELTELVLAQIVKNQIIERLAGFLKQMTPLTKS